MKIKAKIVTCTHESRHGADSYTRFVKKNETVEEAVEAVKASCDYEEGEYGEYFDYVEADVELDTDDFEIVH